MAPKEEVKTEEEKKDVEMKAEETKAEDAEVKEEAKEEVKEEDEEEKPKEPEKPKEKEEDAPEDSRPKVAAGAADINVADATLNVMPSAQNKLLMPVTEGGFQYLLAGVRSTAGLKAGRYMFEVRIIETHHGRDQQQQQQGGQQGRAPMPRHLVRVGLSHAGSSLFLADSGSESCCFDSEGFFFFEKTKKRVSQKFGRDNAVAFLVNLDPSSPNANTVSLFKDGKRLCEPVAIPEKLLGKPLFPTITYKNVTLQVNFGPAPLAPLPFKCHMLGSAAKADVELSQVAKPVGGKYEVVFPVGLPEQGFFDWVDDFVAKHPDYVELSDRKINEWASKSGLWRGKTQGGSLDKPDMRWGLQQMDDLSVKRLLGHIAPTACRNFIVPELKSNLLAGDRKKALAKFASPAFKKTATVIMGEPTAEYKAKVQELLLADKKAKAEAERKKKAAEEERKRLIEEKKKKAEAARKAAKRKREGEDAEAEEEEKAEEEPKAETKAEEEEVVVELTDAEKALVHRKRMVPDVSDGAIVKAYADFTLPSAEEGFDSVTYAWQPEAAVAKVLKDWIFAKKLTQRVEDLKPGEAFTEQWKKWTKSLQEWRKLHGDWKDPSKRKALLARRKEAKKKEAEEKGEEVKEDPTIDTEDLDVYSVEDVTDLGNGEPLFANFLYEDWTLLSTRYEIHLLLHSFKKDLNDPDRPGFLEKDLAFYFNKYFKKSFTLKNFGVEKLEGLVEHIRDSLRVNEKTGFLEAVLEEETPVAQFVKLTEDHRRDRQRRLDAGDETAELKFPRNAPPPARQPDSRATWQQHRGSAVSHGGKGGPAPRQAASHYSGGGGGGGYRGGNGSHYSSRPPHASAPQKRAYTPSGPSSYSAKAPRTSSYGSGGGYYRR